MLDAYACQAFDYFRPGVVRKIMTAGVVGIAGDSPIGAGDQKIAFDRDRNDG